MISLKPDKDINVQKIRIPTRKGSISALVLSPIEPISNAPGILWIHGGGYIIGSKETIYMSCAVQLVKKYGAVIITPDYRLAMLHPYPAAIDDCYDSLLYLKNNAEEYGIRSDQIMVGGVSAGGGLTAALCIMARDRGEVNIAYQMPLYPMLDNFDTDSSRNNHGKIWNTRRNHFGWRMYLRGDAKKEVSAYAAAARCTDYSGLPPAYTFVGDGEPFYCETLSYVAALKAAGVEASADVYPTNIHAFDMMRPELDISKQAVENFCKQFEYAVEHYYAP